MLTTVFSIDESRRLWWQAELLWHSHKAVGQEGPVVCLLSSDASLPARSFPGELVRVPRMSPHPLTGSVYAPLNKPAALAAWARGGDPAESVLVLDPDCVFRERLTLQAEPGRPAATPCPYLFLDHAAEQTVLRRFCRRNARLARPVGIPLLLSRGDLATIAPVWQERTEAMQDDPWIRATFPWIAEMWGYIIAAAELGLDHTMPMLASLTGEQDHAPLVHYTMLRDYAGKAWRFDKYAYRPWTPPAEPGLDVMGSDRYTVRLLRELAAEKGNRRMTEGYLERLDGTTLVGWAVDPDHPDRPVALRVLVDGAEVARIRADQPRPDVAEAGRGGPACGFSIDMTGHLPASAGAIAVLCADSGAELDGSPLILTGRAERTVEDYRALDGVQPRLTVSSPTVVVIDDFLPPSLHRQLLLWAKRVDYRPLNTAAPLMTVWRQADGVPYQAMNGLQVDAERNTGQPEESGRFPGGGPLDLFAAALNAVLPQFSAHVGAAGADWRFYTISVFAYPHGTGLSLHQDAVREYSGAFTYYLTPDWDPHWGGVLMALDPSTPPEAAPPTVYGGRTLPGRSWFDSGDDAARMMEPGIATAIFPKGNRLVLIRPEVQHFVSRVDAAAGDRTRLALSGFFNRGLRSERPAGA